MTGRELAERHVSRFNDAVQTGDWTLFVSGFADDAVLTFPHVSFTGREDIRRAYEEQPPDDVIQPLGIQENDERTAIVAFAWSRGGTGRMELQHERGLVTRLAVLFDE